jgi:hypothetical protein
VALTILGLRPNKLAFPGTKPGFDRGHLASVGVLQTSAVFQPNGNFVDVSRGITGTGGGSGGFSSVIDSAIGPAMIPSAGTTSTNMVTFPKPNGTVYADTMACIVRFSTTQTASAGYLLNNFNAVSGLNASMLYLGANAYTLNYSDGTGFMLFDYTALAGHPAFIAFCNYNTKYNWLIRDLSNGQVFSGTGFATSTMTADTNPIIGIGNRYNDYVRPCTGTSIAAVMYAQSIPNLLSISQLRQWANDPWSFWYPQKFDLADLRLPTQPVGPTISGGTLPTLGVG